MNKSNNELAVLLRHNSGKAIHYPKDHKVGMKVPKGGSNCAKCEYLKGKQQCEQEQFVRWNGSSRILAPVDEFCCDFFEAKK